MKFVKAASFLAAAFLSVAAAPEASAHDRYDDGRRNAFSAGFQRGRDDGYEHGVRDARRHRGFEMGHDDRYRRAEADSHHGHGARRDYATGYRRGYEQAYREGFRSHRCDRSCDRHGRDRGRDRDYGRYEDGRYGDDRYDGQVYEEPRRRY